MGGYIFLLLASLLTSAGQLCQKQAAIVWGRLAGRSERGVLTLRWVLAAFFLLGFGMVAWLGVLRVLPVSQAYPMLSLNFAFVALAARFVFGEKTTQRHWWGVIAIMIGVILLGISP
jgi:undecaprenyl phosphate-alpha-L-ara4N flippase subunit ArnE